MRTIRDGTKHTNSHWTFNGKPVITVDFDHTITRKCLACDDKLDNDGVQEGAVKALRFLHKHFRIWIFTGDPKMITSDSDHDEGEKIGRSIDEIKLFLDKHKIPYDRILQTKPPAIFLIDDRAITHRSWEETLYEIEERMRM